MSNEDTYQKLVIDVLNYLLKYPDEMRHAIIADSDDWDDMNPTLAMFEQLHFRIYANALGDEADDAWRHMMRAMMEVIYVKGYRRGLDEQTSVQSLGPFEEGDV